MTRTTRQTERRAGRRERRSGFSVVELLIVVAITSIGFVALLDLQVSSIRGLSYPTQLTAAVNLGEHFLQTLKMEAIEWTPASEPPEQNPNLQYLSTIDPNGQPDWQLAFGVVGAGDMLVDQAGSDVRYDRGLTDEFDPRKSPRFCVHYRLSYPYASQKLIRAEVRVLWLRDQANWQLLKDCPLDMAEARFRSIVQSVTMTDLIMLNTFI